MVIIYLRFTPILTGWHEWSARGARVDPWNRPNKGRQGNAYHNTPIGCCHRGPDND